MAKQLTIFDPIIEDLQVDILDCEQHIQDNQTSMQGLDNNDYEDRNEINHYRSEIEWYSAEIADKQAKIAEYRSMVMLQHKK